MEMERARELIKIQVDLHSGYNRNAVRLILREIQLHHGQNAVDELIRELDLERIFGLEPGRDFSNVV